VLSCYPTVTVRGKANVTVCAFYGFSRLGGLGSQVGQITTYITLTFLVGVGRLKMFASGRFRRLRHCVCCVLFRIPEFRPEKLALYSSSLLTVAVL